MATWVGGQSCVCKSSRELGPEHRGKGHLEDVDGVASPACGLEDMDGPNEND